MTDEAPLIDTTVPHSARIWNYWLGGRDNYEVDRVAGERYRSVFPGVVEVARASRGFLLRTVRHLAGPVGIRQFLDIGTGLPGAENVHDTAQDIAPDTRVVYVDNDPLVIAHARALLAVGPPGVTDFLRADLHDPDAILRGAARTLDLSRPVALVLSGVLGHVGTYEEARSIVGRLLAGLPAGSHLTLNDGGSGAGCGRFEAAQRAYNDSGAAPYHLRTREEIAGFFTGLDLIDPGVVSCPRWRPGPDGDPAATGDLDVFGGVGRKP
ncbi:SAM-dependent methyltransferase [Streptomyces marincola]|uniref:SAM-dependent methyltransferase n=1 Tax=Streptomyces marincola TaxID=2878388 RepID=UPI0021000C4E|nr:SAM-dependent methyltransferase [Streptomyces marincola]